MRSDKSKTNIVLIGMPACGKSTVGVVLAKTVRKSFMDTDLLIQEYAKKTLQEIIDQDGLENFQIIEEQVLLSINTENSVISTGGSAVYYEESMAHLKENGLVVYLALSLETLNDRLDNMSTRGIAMGRGETLSDLYEKRIPLYELYADIIIETETMSLEETVAEIIRCL